MLHELCFTHAWTSKKAIHHDMKWNQPNSSQLLNEATKSPTPFPPLFYLCGCTLRMCPTGSFLKQPATSPSPHPTSCAASIFQSRCKLISGRPLINQPMHTSCCCCYHSTCIHVKWRVSNNVLTFFTTIFCELILFFSSLFHSHPHWCGYLRPLPELKDTTFTPFRQQQQW